jgi:hypothetical protein
VLTVSLHPHYGPLRPHGPLWQDSGCWRHRVAEEDKGVSPVGYGYPSQYGGQGYGGGSAGYGPPPPNHLVWAIITTIMCCWATGIVAIVYAAQVDSKYAAGDYHGAVDASNKAKWWSAISAITLLVIILLYLLFVFAGVAVFGSGAGSSAAG